MPFTNNGNVLVYGAITEHGIDRVAQLLMQERPSLFNYATANVIKNPALLCQAIPANPQVAKSGDPLITQERPLPVVGTSGIYALDYGFQLTVAKIDFSPANVVTLPPPLAPMKPQRLALQIEVTGGVGLPSADTIHSLPPVPVTPPIPDIGKDVSAQNQTVIHAAALTCFRADFFMVLGVQQTTGVLSVIFDGVKLTGVVEPEIESILEAYINLVVQLVVLPRLKAAIPMTFHVVLPKLSGNISLTLAYDLSLTPAPATLPNNPALEEDQLKVFVMVKEGH